MVLPRRQPAPLSDLLAELRSRGVAIGIREHYEVATLLERWPELATLKDALGAILGTDREEARVVCETFDELYPGVWQDLGELERLLLPVLAEDPEDEEQIGAVLERLHGEKEVSTVPPERRVPATASRSGRLLRAFWPGLLVAAGLLAAIVYFAWPAPDLPVPPLSVIQKPPPLDPEATLEPRSPEPDPEQLHVGFSTPLAQPRWARGAVAGGTLGLAVFLWLYWVRTGREARRVGYRLLAASADSLADPQTYALDLSGLEPPFDGGLFDDVAMLLSRQATVAEARQEIDVDRSLKRTLEAGLAPRLVFEKRTSAQPLLVFEDISAEMRPYRLRTAALLSGLRARGVYFEHWQFDGDARQLLQETGPAISLQRLIRQRSASPLLILSSGQGILNEDFEPAEWVGHLHYWLSCAWLHPNPDPATWRRSVTELPLSVWPLNAEGLAAAARHLATGETAATATGHRLKPPRPVTPLQVNRLRRLLDLSPRRDAGIGELLRQEFCPHVPVAAVAEAVAAPPLRHPPAIGPSDDEVRTFLIQLLDQSRPRVASAAEKRWQLDRALQGIHLPTERAQSIEALRQLGDSPLAAEVAAAVAPLAVADGAAETDGASLSGDVRGTLVERVLSPIDRDARRQGREHEGEGTRRWSWPTLTEMLAPLIILGLVSLATPYLGPLFNDQLEAVEDAFELTVSYPEGDVQRGPFELQARQIVPGTSPPSPLQRARALVGFESDRSVAAVTRLYQDDEDVGEFTPRVVRGEEERGHWYWVGAQLENGVFGVSRPVWVESVATGLLVVTFVDNNGQDLGELKYEVNRSLGVLSGPFTLEGTAKVPLTLYKGEWMLSVVADGYVNTQARVISPSQPVVVLESVKEARARPPLRSVSQKLPGNTRLERTGLLRIVGYPKASSKRLSFDGETWDGTNPVTLQPGQTTVRFDGGVSASWERTVEIRAAQTTTFVFPVEGENGLVDVYFEFDKSDLSSQARQTLARKNAEFMIANPKLTFMLEGHTDERRSNEYNLALAQNFADAVLDYLVALGIDRSRLKTISYGEERPVCTDRTESCWQRNRRVHFRIEE